MSAAATINSRVKQELMQENDESNTYKSTFLSPPLSIFSLTNLINRHCVLALRKDTYEQLVPDEGMVDSPIFLSNNF